MRLLALIFILLIFIGLLIFMAFQQMHNAGIKVKDFWSFIKANQNLDNLYNFAKKYEKMTPQEQIIYLAEAEKMFEAFDRIPESVWEDEHEKYAEVLDTYKDIKVMRWNESQEYALAKTSKLKQPKEIKFEKT